MVNEILTALGIPYKESRFLRPPKTTYAIFTDALNRRGGDNINLLNQHNVTIEIYSTTPDSEIETKLEKILDEYALEFDKMPRYWIQEEQLYQVVYEFMYYEKGGI